jgi:hypothetical protein
VVYVYQSEKSIQVLERSEELDGGPPLPGLSIPLSDLFERDEDEPAQGADVQPGAPVRACPLTPASPPSLVARRPKLGERLVEQAAED